MRIPRILRCSPLGISLLGAIPALAAPPSGEQQADRADLALQPPRLLAQVVLHFPPDAPPDAHGDVTIRVAIDAAGVVTGVEVLSGPEVFSAEARDAGYRLLFAPALRDGVAVASSAVIYFHFAPPAEVLPPPVPDDGGAGEMVVHAVGEDAHDTHSRVTLGAIALEQTAAGLDLAEATAQVAGVTLSRGTADTAKPIIRGQSERRLLLLFDGVRHESQKWGPEHAPEIDLFAAGAVSVIKGAAGARYGPDAIGGVLLVTPPPMRTAPGLEGRVLLTGGTNGPRGYGALRLDGVAERQPARTYRLEGNYSRSASARTPDYVLGNTAAEQWNLGAAVEQRLSSADAILRLAWQHYDLRAGVFYGAHVSTPDEFQAQLAAGAPVNADLWDTSTAIERPYQSVQHDRVALHGEGAVGAWSLSGVYAFQRNHRQEYAQVRSAVTGAQYDFTLRTHSLDLLAQHPHWVLGDGGTLEGGVGAQGLFQENVYRGYALLPNYRGLGGGVFATERALLGWGDIEVGARYDHLSRTAFLSADDFGRHVQRGSLDASVCTLYDGGTGARCPATYNTASVSLGGLWHAIPEVLDLKLDLSSASRFPNADELYLIGTAPTFPVYAVGRPDLGVETTWGASPTVGLRLALLEAEVSGYANITRDFIYFAPELGADGTPLYDVTIEGAWPRYTYSPVDALFTGADGQLSLGPEARVGLELQGALVRAYDLSDGAFLVGTPPDQASAAVVVRPAPRPWLEAPRLSVRLDGVARQSRTEPTVDFAPAPAGYLLLGGGLSASLPLRQRSLRVGLDATNLLSASYREYTSLLRYYADQPGRDVRIRVGTEF